MLEFDMSASSITRVTARQLLDARGIPTIESEVHTVKSKATAMAPSGVTVGMHECMELRDGGKAYFGKGVKTAIRNVKEVIEPALRGKDASKQRQIDELLLKLDGTSNQAKLGGNALVSVSWACARVAAQSLEIPLFEHIGKLFGNSKPLLPVPSFTMINGGRHAGNAIEFQEFLVLPTHAASFSESIQMGCEIYQNLQVMVRDKFGKQYAHTGYTGGLAPPFTKNEDAIKLISHPIKQLGYEKRAKIAIHAAAGSTHKAGRYKIDGMEWMGERMVQYYSDITARYPIAYITDPFYGEDWGNFVSLTKELNGKTKVFGDELTASNVDRSMRALKLKACDGIALKPNQVATLSTALDAAKFALSNDLKVIVVHRAGETEDNFITDLSVGIANGIIQCGAPARGERTSKYNQLLRIEEMLGSKAKMASW